MKPNNQLIANQPIPNPKYQITLVELTGLATPVVALLHYIRNINFYAMHLNVTYIHTHTGQGCLFELIGIDASVDFSDFSRNNHVISIFFHIKVVVVVYVSLINIVVSHSTLQIGRELMTCIAATIKIHSVIMISEYIDILMK